MSRLLKLSWGVLQANSTMERKTTQSHSGNTAIHNHMVLVGLAWGPEDRIYLRGSCHTCIHHLDMTLYRIRRLKSPLILRSLGYW